MKVERCGDCHRRLPELSEYVSGDTVRRRLCLGCLADRRKRGEVWWRAR